MLDKANRSVLAIKKSSTSRGDVTRAPLPLVLLLVLLLLLLVILLVLLLVPYDVSSRRRGYAGDGARAATPTGLLPGPATVPSELAWAGCGRGTRATTSRRTPGRHHHSMVMLACGVCWYSQE
jgi:hypothetical protein